MVYLNPPQKLETERLMLRRLTADDVAPFVRFMTDEKAVQYMPFPPEQKTPEGAEGMMQWVMGAYDSDDAVFVMAITEKDKGDYIGSTGASPVAESDAIEFFYTLLPAYWGKGYGTEAAAALVAYLSETVKAPRLMANVFTENIASVRVLEKLGFQRASEGEKDENGLTPAVYTLTSASYHN